MDIFQVILVVSTLILAVLLIVYYIKHVVMFSRLRIMYKGMTDNEIRIERKLRDSGYFTKFIFRWTSKKAERFF